MTAEVAVLNRSAVALAADSAVTLSGLDPASGVDKIFQNENKLFELSKNFPLGLMIYNICGVLSGLKRERKPMRERDDREVSPSPAKRRGGLPIRNPLRETLARLEREEGAEIAKIVRREIARTSEPSESNS